MTALDQNSTNNAPHAAEDQKKPRIKSQPNKRKRHGREQNAKKPSIKRLSKDSVFARHKQKTEKKNFAIRFVNYIWDNKAEIAIGAATGGAVRLAFTLTAASLTTPAIGILGTTMLVASAAGMASGVAREMWKMRKDDPKKKTKTRLLKAAIKGACFGSVGGGASSMLFDFVGNHAPDIADKMAPALSTTKAFMANGLEAVKDNAVKAYESIDMAPALATTKAFMVNSWDAVKSSAVSKYESVDVADSLSTLRKTVTGHITPFIASAKELCASKWSALMGFVSHNHISELLQNETTTPPQTTTTQPVGAAPEITSITDKTPPTTAPAQPSMAKAFFASKWEELKNNAVKTYGSVDLSPALSTTNSFLANSWEELKNNTNKTYAPVDVVGSLSRMGEKVTGHISPFIASATELCASKWDGMVDSMNNALYSPTEVRASVSTAFMGGLSSAYSALKTSLEDGLAQLKPIASDPTLSAPEADTMAVASDAVTTAPEETNLTEKTPKTSISAAPSDTPITGQEPTADDSIAQAPELPDVPAKFEGVITPEDFAKLTPELQTFMTNASAHGSSLTIMRACKEASFHLFNKTGGDLIAAESGSRLVRRGLEEAMNGEVRREINDELWQLRKEDLLVGTDVGQQLLADFAYINAHGAHGMKQNKEAAIIWALLADPENKFVKEYLPFARDKYPEIFEEAFKRAPAVLKIAYGNAMPAVG